MNFKDFSELVASSRSVRRFKEGIAVSGEDIRALVGLARLTPSSRNIQPLKYILVNEAKARAAVFSCLNWAKALTDWGGPAPSQRPGAYVIILGDTAVADRFSVDPGISAQTIMLGARLKGLGGCIIASVERDELRSKLAIDGRFEICLLYTSPSPRDLSTSRMPSSA